MNHIKGETISILIATNGHHAVIEVDGKPHTTLDAKELTVIDASGRYRCNVSAMQAEEHIKSAKDSIDAAVDLMGCKCPTARAVASLKDTLGKGYEPGGSTHGV